MADLTKKLFWISFVYPERGCVGVSVVEADDPKHAIQVAYGRGCNPGGEAAIQDISDHGWRVPEEMRFKLLDPAVAAHLAGEPDPQMEALEREAEAASRARGN